MRVAADERSDRPVRALAFFDQRRLAQHDAVQTLELLDTYALDDDRSPQRERATVLRIDALLALGQPEAARVHALRYLSREPETATSTRLRALVSGRQGAN